MELRTEVLQVIAPQWSVSKEGGARPADSECPSRSSSVLARAANQLATEEMSPEPRLLLDRLGTDRQDGGFTPAQRSSVPFKVPLQRIRTILLHESPDLDAAFSSWLLRGFGEDRYAGVQDAELKFRPVGELPEGRTAEDLEREGILAVDTGGGRFDNHGQAAPTSSSLLVATDLAINNDRALEKLLRFVHRNDVTGEGVRSSDPTDQLLSLPTILRGLNVLFPRNPRKVVEDMHGILDAIYATEVDWFEALADADRAHWLTTSTGGRVMGIVSESSAAMKVGRFRKADIVAHRTSRFLGIALTRRGKHDRPPFLGRAAALLRAAESLEGGDERCVSSLSIRRAPSGSAACGFSTRVCISSPTAVTRIRA